MSEGLSWPIEKITPVGGPWFSVRFAGSREPVTFRNKSLEAAGIPAEPYPPTPVVITVTRGDQTRSFPMNDEASAQWATMLPPEAWVGPVSIASAKVAAALRELGVGRD